ncbi:ubiE/COQ5 methyltransferase family protein [Dictyostelium purpureum]|uniref:2-methoxy-6-polyprenyl-1,4-benzoquinol methylase, mitochondrial n=1 Tax=Dictyostelium purpureum TaxID=5786 RepID=F0ZGC2_DICPU|nr:ubiE/COQ5 methyltransferase family protein [Dictyostelium purpureum]EGC37016.1 ubiE/COQ5 methyltransferase family protein [Dictyostelium purpureum]|eukprot:XP_003286444.1 ubiE/COQ5 methyltransferase family protein [Dictyostelium purpureum]
MLQTLNRSVRRMGLSFSRFYTSTNNPTPSSSSSSSSQQPQEKTHFGFKTVNKEDKEDMVKEVFDSVSSKYDLMNDVMSMGIHRLWKDELMNTLNPTPGSHLLDVAGGTGDVSFRFLDRIKNSPNYFPNIASSSTLKSSSLPSSATVYDINQSMLNEGKKRGLTMGYTDLSDPSIDWVQGNSENLPFKDETFNCYTVSFGIRNCTNIDQVLREAHRVLKKGGRFLCLEFTQVPNPLLRYAYDTYSFNVIPVMGQLITGDHDSYKYLVESIRQFPNQDKFAQMITDAGFKQVTYKNLTFGVVAIHSGFKL